MDINKAVRFVTEDKTWLSKLLIGVLMSVLSFLIVPALILQGYVIKIIRRVMNGAWDGLPEWDDWSDLLRDGFFVTVAEIVYTLPFILLMIVGIAATGGLASLTGSEDAAGLIATTGGLGMLCLIFIFIVALLLLMPAILIQYAIKDDLGALFRFSEVFAIMRANISDILIAFLVSVVATLAITLVTGVLSLVPCLGWIVAFLIGLATAPYISFVTGHLYGQIAAKVLGNKAGGSMTGVA